MTPRPFLRWAGGKRRLLETIARFIPASHGRYYEPFMGGAAVFWHHRPAAAVLSDASPELVNCYQVLQSQPDELIAALSEMATAAPISKARFMAIRGLDPAKIGPIERAARVVFLNKLCFNGLYRVSRKGVFNTSFDGSKVDRPPTICDEEALRACSVALQGHRVTHDDFEHVRKTAVAGDFVYLDSPYIPEPGKKPSFTSYTAEGFGARDHMRLSRLFHDLDAAGVFVLASNSDCDGTRALYGGCQHVGLTRSGAINSDTSNRGEVSELLIVGQALEAHLQAAGQRRAS